MSWTTEPPTAEGLYRVFHKNIKQIFKSGSWASWEEVKNSDGWLYILLCDDQQEINEYIKEDEKDGFRVY